MRFRNWTNSLILVAVVVATGCSKKAGESHEGGEEHGGHEEEHGAKGHEEHGDESHEEHGAEGHAEQGAEGHAEQGGEEAGHDEKEEGTVHLSPEAMAQIDIKVGKVIRRAIPSQIHTTARVDYDESRIAHVGARIPGRVNKVLKTLGDVVEEGEALATLDSVVLGESIAQQRAASVDEELARKTLERERSLVAEKLSSEQQLIEAEAAHQKALAAKNVASEQLRLYGGRGVKGSTFQLRSPIAGKIVQQHLTLGELITPEDKVYTVADVSALWIWVDIFERDLGRVHIDDDATVITDAYGSETFIGKVAYIMDEVDTDSRTVRARIDIDNTKGKLKPGMFANVTLSDPHGNAASETEGIAVVPSAIQRDGDGWIAFVMTGEREYERREVKIGVRTDEFIEVLSGLHEGENVVTTGGFLLKSEVAKKSMGGGHSH